VDTATARPTKTLTPVPTAAAASVIGLMTGNAWLRQAPEANSTRLGPIARTGEKVELLAVYGEWCHIRLSPSAQAEATGWVPMRWVGTLDPIPGRIITPSPAP
jgi:hypothetical protein